MLALSSVSLTLRVTMLTLPELRGLDAADVGEASLESAAKACVLAMESWVVALDRSCGLEGAIECDVEGRDSNPSAGRGGSGGGAAYCDASDAVEFLREKLRIMLSVGFAKSCDSPGSPLALLLFWVGVVGELCPSESGVWGSALPVSSIKMVAGGHLDSNARLCYFQRHDAVLEWACRRGAS
jgi:hypothetical protein